ncbi:hypothetical protein KBG31_02910 [Patescibacteria group bacterium]|nr:hypothetical protein [Patescibacteria group bacterium]HOM77639.1 hypothetical protein [bacterium]
MLKILKLILPFFSVILFRVNAQTQEEYFFDFSTNTHLIPQSGIIEIKILYKGKVINPDRYKIKPYSNGNSIQIMDADKGEWVFTTNSWGKMPSIENTTKIRILGTKEKANLYIKIKNTTTGEEFKTPEKILWSSDSYNNYAARINQNTSDWRQKRGGIDGETQESERAEEKALDIPTQEQTQRLENLKNKKSSLVWNLSGMGVSAIIGFIKKDDRMLL